MDKNKSIYQVAIENKDELDKSAMNIYKYIKMRKHNKKYEYSENNKIDRIGHTYLDYLLFTNHFH